MAPKRQKTIEEQYQKLSQLDHILLRPDSYVGSIEVQHDTLWVYDKSEGMVLRELKYVPGLYKIFDEILVNAADNYVRDPDIMTYIKVNIDEQGGWISVENDGHSLPVEIHQEHKMHVPEMVFGHLLTSDNYDDNEKKIVGGRNGYGAKLTNIFSTRFEVECGDSERGKKLSQVWTGNMREKGKARISPYKDDSFTKITFWPDFARFGLKKFDKDFVSLLTRRVYDLAGTTPKDCRVHLNGKHVGVKDFKDYVDLYMGTENTVVYERHSERWEFAMTVSDGQFQQVSFVNGIATLKGGTHVQHVADQLIDSILKRASSKNKGGMDIKPYHVRNYLWIFVNCRIENPTFDSQTKETMTLKQGKFGSKCEVSDVILNKVMKTGIVDLILRWAKAKEAIDLGKTLKSGKQRARRLLNIPKLEDANLAGTGEGPNCTLILTEGDSAKSLAVAGLSVIGRDRYGVFPLRGKLLNVRDASFAQTMANAEVANITKILGIEPRKQYDSTQGLRYGHIMVMADQDYDGSHIKGLILNLVEHWWPSLFQLPGFMQEFVTPIVKATRKGISKQFFTMPEYEAWKEENNNGRGFSVKYYKGLGTSTTIEAKEYFKNLGLHSLDFEYEAEGDAEQIDLAFNKKRADDRKDWINGCDDAEFVDHTQAALNYTDFVQKELVLFAKYNVMRSIPCGVDGFKPVQRKILWACFRRNLKSDTKVAQLAGYVSEHSAYHHGEASLTDTIVGLAQGFVGSNNINLLVPSGQFGTRLQGGKDAASARYIFTRLEKIARLIFHPDDDKILEYMTEEGRSIEPRWYIPVIPLVLVNGAEGIGTGWSTSISNYNPREIIANLKRYMRCKPMREMCPWYRGFRGSIVPAPDKDSFEFIGVVEKRSSTMLEITELPIRRWTQDFKEFLQSLLDAEGKGAAQIEDFKEYHTEVTVHFVITVTEAQMESLESAGFEKVFKLRGSMPASNMFLFDRHGKISKYATELEIIEDFAELRLEYYGKRKAYMARKLLQRLEVLSEKARFIRLVIEEKLKVRNRKKDALIEDLKRNRFRPLHELTEDDEDADDQVGGDKKQKGVWDYLLGMPLWSLTWERIEHFEQQIKERRAELAELRATAPEEMWEKDLDAILRELDVVESLSGMSAEAEKRLRADALRKASNLGPSVKKRPRVGSEAPLMTQPLPVASTSSQLDDRILIGLQERHLQATADKFPGLFDDVLPESARSTAPPKKPKGRGRPSNKVSGPGDDIGGKADVEEPPLVVPGSTVEIHGLQGAVELNGRSGTVVQFDAAAGRWEVAVDEFGTKRVKEENLSVKTGVKRAFEEDGATSKRARALKGGKALSS